MKPCNRCKRPIIWGRSEHARDERGQRRWIPLDPEPHPLGVIDLKPDKTAVFAGPSHDPAAIRYAPHEATCSDPYRPVRHRSKESAT